MLRPSMYNVWFLFMLATFNLIPCSFHFCLFTKLYWMIMSSQMIQNELAKARPTNVSLVIIIRKFAAARAGFVGCIATNI